MPIVRAKRRVWRGRDRGYLRKLQKALVCMTQREQRVQAFEESTAIFGVYFDNTNGATITAAMQLLMDRIDEALLETK